MELRASLPVTRGSVLRASGAQVGDTIVVHFKNNTPFPTGMHPHGVWYVKSSEGALYNDGTSGADKSDDAVSDGRDAHVHLAGSRPGGTRTGRRQLGDVDVPRPHGRGCRHLRGPRWPDHHHQAGQARPDGSPKDVDRQFVALFMVADENQSPYLERNMRRYMTARGRSCAPSSRPCPADEFTESNLMHSINGYVYGNGPLMKMHVGERVRWYVMSMGTDDVAMYGSIRCSVLIKYAVYAVMCLRPSTESLDCGACEVVSPRS